VVTSHRNSKPEKRCHLRQSWERSKRPRPAGMRLKLNTPTCKNAVQRCLQKLTRRGFAGPNVTLKAEEEGTILPMISGLNSRNASGIPQGTRRHGEWPPETRAIPKMRRSQKGGRYSQNGQAKNLLATVPRYFVVGVTFWARVSLHIIDVL